MSFPYGMFSLYRTWLVPSITQQKHSTFDFKTVIISTSTAHVERKFQIVGGKWLPIWIRRNIVRWQGSICTSCINRSNDLYTLQNKPYGPWITATVCQAKLLNHFKQCSNTVVRSLNTKRSYKMHLWKRGDAPDFWGNCYLNLQILQQIFFCINFGPSIVGDGKQMGCSLALQQESKFNSLACS